jgi:hypothetical protein
MLAYKEFTIEEALTYSDGASKLRSGARKPSHSGDELPPQIGSLEHVDAAHVTYISPASMRLSLERHIDEHGEAVLERNNLQALDPELFYNFWWYCARKSFPFNHFLCFASFKNQLQLFLLQRFFSSSTPTSIQYQ